MTSRGRVIAACLLLYLMGGCGSSRNTPVGLMEDNIKTLNETSAVLESIKDGPSVEAARPKLKTLAEHAGENLRKGQELSKKMTDEEQRQFGEQYKDRLMEAQQRNARAWLRVLSLPGGKQLHDEWTATVGKDGALR